MTGGGLFLGFGLGRTGGLGLGVGGLGAGDGGTILGGTLGLGGVGGATLTIGDSTGLGTAESAS